MIAGAHAAETKALGAIDLTFLGIGAIIGTGIFVLTGTGAVQAGPALMLSFVIAAIACGLAALSYAEFASTIPSPARSTRIRTPRSANSSRGSSAGT